MASSDLHPLAPETTPETEISTTLDSLFESQISLKDSTSPAEPLTEFTLFSKLPVEIRLQIWTEAAQLPRVVKFLVSCYGARPRSTYAVTKPPAILHANLESRMEALKLYMLLDSAVPMTPSLGPSNRLVAGGASRKYYINPEIDTAFISFDAWLCPFSISPELCERIEKVAFRFKEHRRVIGNTEMDLFSGHLIAREISTWKNLKEIVFIVGKSNYRQIGYGAALVEDEEEEHQRLARFHQGIAQGEGNPEAIREKMARLQWSCKKFAGIEHSIAKDGFRSSVCW